MTWHRTTFCSIFLLCFAPTLPSAAAGSSACDQAKHRDVWCDSCGAGFIAGIPIRSEMLFEALDAHGHEIDPATLRCETCRTALETGGFCDEHRRGYVDGAWYLSRLTYHLTRGQRQDSEVACPVCRSDDELVRWCDEHDRGRVGNVTIVDRTEFDEASRAVEILLRARAMVAQCETCAAAMATDGRCPRCRVLYEDGEPVAGAP